MRVARGQRRGRVRAAGRRPAALGCGRRREPPASPSSARASLRQRGCRRLQAGLLRAGPPTGTARGAREGSALHPAGRATGRARRSPRRGEHRCPAGGHQRPAANLTGAAAAMAGERAMAARADRPVSSGQRTSSPAVARAASRESLSPSHPMPSGAARAPPGSRAGAPAEADQVAQPVGPRVRAPHRPALGEPVSRSHGVRRRLDQDAPSTWSVLNRSL